MGVAAVTQETQSNARCIRVPSGLVTGYETEIISAWGNELSHPPQHLITFPINSGKVASDRWSSMSSPFNVHLYDCEGNMKIAQGDRSKRPISIYLLLMSHKTFATLQLWVRNDLAV
jgi:hypothetical protein